MTLALVLLWSWPNPFTNLMVKTMVALVTSGAFELIYERLQKINWFFFSGIHSRGKKTVQHLVRRFIVMKTSTEQNHTTFDRHGHKTLSHYMGVKRSSANIHKQHAAAGYQSHHLTNTSQTIVHHTEIHISAVPPGQLWSLTLLIQILWWFVHSETGVDDLSSAQERLSEQTGSSRRSKTFHILLHFLRWGGGSA